MVNAILILWGYGDQKPDTSIYCRIINIYRIGWLESVSYTHLSNSSEKLQNNFSLNDQSPMCFWFGNGVIDSKAVKFRNESKSKV